MSVRRTVLFRVLSATLTIAASALLGLAGAAPASATVPAAATATAYDNTAGTQSLAACLASGRTVSALFLLDMSGSLNEMDPDGIRYEGVQTALESLIAASSEDERDLTVEVAVAGFDSSYKPPREIVDWRELSDDDQATQIAEIVDRVRAETVPAAATDFRAALEGARDDILDRGVSGSCKVVLWFTDGFWDIGDETQVDSDRQQICAEGGLVDQFRGAGVTLVALHVSQSADVAAKPELAAITLGSANGLICGTQPIPEGAASGIYLQADDASGIKALFLQIANLLAGCTPTGQIGNTIDPGITRVRITIPTTQQADTVTLSLPDGTTLIVPAEGDFSESGYTGRSQSDDHYVALVVNTPPTPEPGQWLVNPNVPPNGDIEFCVATDLRLELDEQTLSDVQAGSDSTIGVLATNAGGEVASLAPFTVAGTSATVLGPDGNARPSTSIPNTQGTGFDVTVNVQATDARLDLDAALELTTSSGLALTPLTLSDAFAVRLSEYFPTVEPIDELQLGSAIKKDPVSATLELRGSSRGETQVCLDAPIDVTVPDDAADASPAYPIGCIVLAADEARTVEVSVATSEPVEGDGSATLPLTLIAAPDQNGAVNEATAAMPILWRFTDPINVGTLAWVAALVFASSIILPALALFLANWLTGRYDATRLRVFRAPLTIGATTLSAPTPSDPTSALGEQPVIVELTRSVPLATRARPSLTPGFFGRRLTRRIDIAPLILTSRVPLDLRRQPQFWAEVPHGHVLLSTAGANPAGNPKRAPATPGLGFVAFWVAPTLNLTRRDGSEGELIVIFRQGEVRSNEMDAEIRAAAWPGRVHALASETERTQEPPTADPTAPAASSGWTKY